MSSSAHAALAATALAACQPPPPAPEDLDALGAWIFARFDDPRERELAEGLEAMLEFVEAHEEELLDGYSLLPLAPEDVEGLDARERTPERSIGIGVGTRVAHPVEALAHVAMRVPTPEVQPAKFERFERRWSSDPDCFARLDCPRAAASDDVRAVHAGGLVKVDYLEASSWRWVRVQGGEAFVRRLFTLEPDATSSALAPTMLERYGLWVHLPWGEGTLVVNTAWVVFGDGFAFVDPALRQMVGAVKDDVAAIGAWLDAHPAP